MAQKEYNAGEAIGAYGLYIVYRKAGVNEEDLNWIPPIHDERYTSYESLSTKLKDTIKQHNEKE